MRILSLNPYVPHPLDCGGHLRTHHTLAALAGQHDVTFVAQVRTGEDFEDWDLASHFAKKPILVPCTSNDHEHPASDRLRTRVPRPWAGRPMSIAGHDFDSFWNALAALPLESYHAVQVRTFHLIPYALAIRNLSPHIRLILDLDDVQSVYKRRIIRSVKIRWISRWRFQLYLDYWRIRLYENRFLRECDSVWICSELDRGRVARWAGPGKVLCIPNGVDLAAYTEITPQVDSKKIVFIGDFRQEPNVEGIVWFHDRVLQSIRAAVPEAKLWIVGRNPSDKILGLHRPSDGVHVTGRVPDVRSYLAAAAVSVVPLHVGSGTRLKILEAMAAGLPVVSTRIGAEGIDVVDGENLLLADTPEELARACTRLLQDPVRRMLIGDAGRRLARQYDWTSISQTVREFYARLEAECATGTGNVRYTAHESRRPFQ